MIKWNKDESLKEYEPWNMKEEPLNVCYIFWEPSALQKQKNDKHLLVISFARIQVSLCPGKENREF